MQLRLPSATPDPKPTEEHRHGSWLSGSAFLMRAIASAPLMHVLFQESVTAANASNTATLNRGNGEAVEAELAARLTEEKQAELLNDVVAVLGKTVTGFGTLKSITWVWLGGGRKACDFLVTVVGSKREVALPVNVKTRSTTAFNFESWNHAVSTNTLLRVACGLPIVGKKLTRLDTDVTILEFVAGLRTIQPGDYFLLEAVIDGGLNVVDVTSQGLLSHVMKSPSGKTVLAVQRQTGRAGDLLFYPATEVLPDGFDVNAALIDVMLPQALTPAQLVLQNVTKLHMAGADAETIQQCASTFLGATLR